MKNNTSNGKPVYLQIADSIALRIEEKTYAAGAKLPSVKELAKDYNVHTATIKNAFKNLRERGFTANHPGAGIMVRENLMHSLKIALVLPAEYEEPFSLLRGMQEIAGYDCGSIEVMFYKDINESEKCLRKVCENKFSGMIIRPPAKHNSPFINKLHDEYFPLVLIENFSPGSSFWHVDSGVYEAGMAAAIHLIKTRCEPIAVAASEDYFGETFVQGYIDAHRNTKTECWRNNIKYIRNGQSSANATADFLPLKSSPMSIIYASASDAIAGYKTLREKGRDLSWMRIVSFGDFQGCDILNPPIIIIRRDFMELGRRACKLLLQQINMPRNERRISRSDKIEIPHL